MAYQFPPEVDQLVKEHMDSGAYATQNELLLEALRSLSDYKQTVSDVQEAIADEEAGRLRPLEELDAQLRQKYGIAQDA